MCVCEGAEMGQFVFMPHVVFLMFHVKVDVKRRSAHLEAGFALLAAEARQHEEGEGEEAGEGDGHHSQGRRPGQITQRSAICRTHPE